MVSHVKQKLGHRRDDLQEREREKKGHTRFLTSRIRHDGATSHFKRFLEPRFVKQLQDDLRGRKRSSPACLRHHTTDEGSRQRWPWAFREERLAPRGLACRRAKK